MFAEWEKQKAIVLIYPHEFCDFNKYLQPAQSLYDDLIKTILEYEEVILIKHPLCKKHIENCRIVELESNDVWARDSIAISLKGGGYADFIFNGWGNKFESALDNALNSGLEKAGVLEGVKRYDFVLEGGSIDCNGDGILLTNTQCLLNKNRNPHLSKSEIEERLKSSLGIERILWLNHGFLLGDDTDSHIDTLARFISKDSIAYIKCEDSSDVHYEELKRMEAELEELAKRHHLKLVSLPFCKYQRDGISLPASYVNFLFINNALLVPLYNKPSDEIALEIYKKALPTHKVIGINCEILIRQGGSLHCISMQIHN